MTLETLLARSFINRYQTETWFHGASLSLPYLYVAGSPEDVAFIERNFLPMFREQMPTLMLRRAPTAAPKPVTKFPALKPGPWRDLLDEE